MKKSFAITVVVPLSFAMFLVGVCIAGPPESTPTKPFVAQWTGTLYNVGVCVPDTSKVLTVNFGQGSATLLGSASFVFMYCIDPITISGSGWGIVTTANGDKLYERITNLTVTFGDPVAGTPTTWSEDEELLGGTGRFENARGDSKSSGIWTSAEGFPVGFTVPPPMLLAIPPDTGVQNWIGTTKGEVRF
ncbi:MAG TPA: hypothetical protein VFK23_05310 [Nitrospirota bacterium]|nr:hypothetical protein [Nitrospirota bacterium]